MSEYAIYTLSATHTHKAVRPIFFPFKLFLSIQTEKCSKRRFYPYRVERIEEKKNLKISREEQQKPTQRNLE